MNQMNQLGQYQPTTSPILPPQQIFFQKKHLLFSVGAFCDIILFKSKLYIPEKHSILCGWVFFTFYGKHYLHYMVNVLTLYYQ